VSRAPLRPYRFAALALLATILGVAACGTPPELRPKPGSEVPYPSTSASSPTPPALPRPPPLPPTAAPTPTFAEDFAVDCAGRPSGEAVVRVLRRTRGLIGSGARVTVLTGPLCAGTWQYTVVSVPGREPLAAVTKGRPDALRLVTAGTDVCSIPVRTGAPAGILTAAACTT
jgi:hypothetical protein